MQPRKRYSDNKKGSKLIVTLLVMAVVFAAAGVLWFINQKKDIVRKEVEGLVNIELAYNAIAMPDVSEPVERIPVGYVLLTNVMVAPASEKDTITSVEISDVHFVNAPEKGEIKIIAPQHVLTTEQGRDLFYREKDEQTKPSYVADPVHLEYKSGNTESTAYADQINERGGSIDLRLFVVGLGAIDPAKAEGKQGISPEELLKFSDVTPELLNNEIEFTITANIGRNKKNNKNGPDENRWGSII